MSEDTLLAFDFPAVGRKKVTAAFDGGRMTSDGDVLLLAAAERRLGWRQGNRVKETLGRAAPDLPHKQTRAINGCRGLGGGAPPSFG